ncbi:GNAT family N-acetyltransferase [Aliiroseovarius sp. PrR006]|uniref:GNAT family N-acetyltransferase n=1 Tax=Aliiroseovarius sp. PrR006 TaxID=2706883 RepID=UPI0013D88FA4|nr:GNAT family N-acetyltransferase [Aliiroseovarius sp. PrR006]NDW52231.1 GNAT family N-acetyltransferase [Aliiroseovarius sp. PrR006]
MKTCLVSERLTMRRCQRSDFDALYDLVSDIDVARMTATWPHPADPNLTRERCQPFDPAHGMVGVVLLEGTLVDHCRATYDWPIIRADAFSDNPASAHVLKKLGFEELDGSTGHSVARDGCAPLRVFQLLRPES